MPGRLRDLLRKPVGRAGRHPQYLEIVVARSGRSAHTFRLNLDALKRMTIVLTMSALLWFGGTFYMTYSHLAHQEVIASARWQAERIAQLESNNERLAEEKQYLGENVLTMRERVEHLAERVHHLAMQRQTDFPVERASRPQGGMAIPLDTEHTDELKDMGFALLQERLDDLLPQVETTLARELARPVGVPVASRRDITSRYGPRGNPFGRGREFHNGIDFAVDTGTPILATAPGRVVAAAYDGPNGNRVAIDHGYAYRSVYAHLSKIRVKVGDRVKRGQVVGLSGNTGRSSGPHLHYALYYQGRTINPAPYLKTGYPKTEHLTAN